MIAALVRPVLNESDFHFLRYGGRARLLPQETSECAPTLHNFVLATLHLNSVRLDFWLLPDN
jgi:hypothetical protein